MRIALLLISLLMVISLQAQNTKPNASFSISGNEVCVNSCISVSDRSTGEISRWEWFFQGGNPEVSDSRDPGMICYKTPGKYKIFLTVTDNSGNSDLDSAIVSVGFYTPALISVEPMQGQAPLNVQISTTAPAGQCTWYIEGSSYSGMSGLSHIFQQDGNFDICLVTTNPFGCKDSACVDVHVWSQLLQDTSFLVVPNVFTPNNDLQNDIFRTTSSNIVEWDSRIYNRWGQQVFSSNAPDIMWDGMWNGNPCDDGVYVYIIKAIGSDGKIYDISGTLTLFR
ncbi:hypothetical protein SDC9_56149 [bioreactor metagenome]|uniref:PKD domain-containing protein n=1 Tax=bioreactor metagenome TaxID=1076179 RepID=A0A644X121_9ZZZZ